MSNSSPALALGAEAFETMQCIRVLEERCLKLFADAAVRGAMHLYIGQEAVAVGACSALESDDYVICSYRSHGWAIAKGLPVESVLAEILGRETGCCRGRGGTKHLCDRSRGFLPANAIVGGQLPTATGVAFASRYLGEGRVTLAAFGEGATNQGAFHEAMTLAQLWSLPVIFLCENNLYSELTPASDILPISDVARRAEGYGMTSMTCDGMDVVDVANVTAAAREHALAVGPVLIEAKTYRFCGHHTGDPEGYRSSDEVATWRKRDPIDAFAQLLGSVGVPEETLARARDRATASIVSAEAAALRAAEPDVETDGVGLPDWVVRRRDI